MTTAADLAERIEAITSDNWLALVAIAIAVVAILLQQRGTRRSGREAFVRQPALTL